MPIKVLIVDDSAVVRSILRRELARDHEILVVGTAPDPYVARDLILEKNPDVLTLDIEMPRMDGITFLRKLMTYHPMPVVVVSSLTEKGSRLAMEAFNYGAVEVLKKPGSAYSVGEMGKDLIQAVKAAAKVDVAKKAALIKLLDARRGIKPKALTKTTNKIVAIGSSTGGTEALDYLISSLPANFPAIIITQHMPPGFTHSFSQRLNSKSPLEVKEAENGDSVIPGRVLIAPGGKHMVLRRSGARFMVSIKDGPRVNRHKPSVDVMFKSTAAAAGANAVGVILTGMGNDGAKGLLAMKEAGATTIAQDEKSCVVFGMPKVAIELGAAQHIISLYDMPEFLISLLGGASV